MPLLIRNPTTNEEWLNNLSRYGITKELLEEAHIPANQLPLLYHQVKKLKDTKIEKSWQLKMVHGQTVYYRPELGPGPEFALFAAKCGNLGTIQSLPGRFVKTNTKTESIVLLAARAGSNEILQWIHEQEEYKFLLEEERGMGWGIAQFAAQSGGTKTLEWIYKHEQYNHWFEKKDSLNRSFIDFAILFGNVEALKWIKNNDQYAPLLEKKISNLKPGFMGRYITRELLQWTQQNIPHLMSEKDQYGLSIAHYTAMYANVEALEWLHQEYPHLMNGKDKHEKTIAHYAAEYGNEEELQFIEHYYPQLLTEKDERGNSVVHYATESSKPDIIRYLLNNQHYLHEDLWSANKNGDKPKAYRGCNLYEIRNTALFEATQRYIEGAATLVDQALLLTFKAEWHELLLKRHDYNVEGLLSCVNALPEPLQTVIQDLKPQLACAIMDMNNGPTRNHIHAILQSVTPPKTPTLFQYQEATLVPPLRKFAAKIQKEDLNDEELLCLNRMLKDYKQGLVGVADNVSDRMYHKFLSTSRLNQLQPKSKKSQEMAMTPEAMQNYLNSFRTRINQLPLNSDNKKTMLDVILVGLDCIVNKEDTIIEHVCTSFGVLFYLDAPQNKLPLHTDHTPFSDRDAYRDVLQRLRENFFAAAEIAHSAGKLQTFCEMICVGYCFEGRVRDTFNWVAAISELDSFDDLMNYYLNKEYIPTLRVMDERPADFTPNSLYARNFISKRHNNELCKPDALYAPKGKVTREGISQYLEEVLCFEPWTLYQEIKDHIKTLKKELTQKFVVNEIVKQIKIKALTYLLDEIEKGVPPADAVLAMEAKYPRAPEGLISKRVKNIIGLIKAESEPLNARPNF